MIKKLYYRGVLIEISYNPETRIYKAEVVGQKTEPNGTKNIEHLIQDMKRSIDDIQFHEYWNTIKPFCEGKSEGLQTTFYELMKSAWKQGQFIADTFR